MAYFLGIFWVFFEDFPMISSKSARKKIADFLGKKAPE